jgi:hypothetical protein
VAVVKEESVAVVDGDSVAIVEEDSEIELAPCAPVIALLSTLLLFTFVSFATPALPRMLCMTRSSLS